MDHIIWDMGIKQSKKLRKQVLKSPRSIAANDSSSHLQIITNENEEFSMLRKYYMN